MNQFTREEIEAERVDLGEIETTLGFLLRMAQLRAFAHFFRVSAVGLKPGALTVLWVIALNPGLRQGAIARRLMIKPAHMTKLVRAMVDDGLVERYVPPNDRRSVRLSLTKAGKALYERSCGEMHAIHRAERGTLNDREYTDFVALLRKFAGIGTPP